MAIKMIRYTPARFLSVCGTWIYRLLPALHAHLSCTRYYSTLGNVHYRKEEEGEEKKMKL